jgi:hypothetical protein
MSFKGTIQALSLLCMGSVVTSSILLQNGFQASHEVLLPGIDNMTSSTVPEGRTVAPLRWFGQASAQGPNITIVGRNVEQILHHLYTINPDYDSFRNQTQEVPSQDINSRISALQKRQESVCIFLSCVKMC